MGMTATKSKTEKVAETKATDCEKENKPTDSTKKQSSPSDWANFEEQAVPVKALVPLASEVAEVEQVETVVVGGGPSDGYDRSGPPQGRGGYERSDRGGRPPYERRNDYDYQRGGDQYRDQPRNGGYGGNQGGDRPPRGDQYGDRPPRNDYPRGGDQYGDRP